MNSKNIYYLVYKTTHIPTGRFYIGRHVTTDLNDGYLGSGTLITQLLRENDVTDFERVILHFAATAEEMIILEDERIAEVFETSLCLNCMRGDPTLRGVVQHSQHSKDKISKANKGKTRSDAHKAAISRANKGRSMTFTEEHRNKLSQAHKGKVLSEDHKRKISESGTGRRMPPDAIEKTRQAHIGSKRSEETKLKIKEKRSQQVMKKKTWKLQDPLGNIIETQNLKAFCQDHNLGLSKLLDTQKTKKPVERGYSTGWMIIEYFF